MRPALAGALALALAACSSDKEEPQAEPSEEAKPQKDERAAVPGDVASCERDEKGQVACLVTTFDLEKCDEARVLGSMFRDNEQQGTYEHFTAFGLKPECVAELRDALGKQGFRQGKRDDFLATRYGGAVETVLIGMQISADGSVVEWERTKQ